MSYDYDAASEQERLDAARHNIRVVTVAAMRPETPPEKVAVYRGLERSFRVEAHLRQRALGRQSPKT